MENTLSQLPKTTMWAVLGQLGAIPQDQLARSTTTLQLAPISQPAGSLKLWLTLNIRCHFLALAMTKPYGALSLPMVEMPLAPIST